MIWWEQKGVEHIDSASTAVSLAPIHPLFLCPAIIPTLSLHLFLPLYLLLFSLSLSLRCAIIITPLLDTQAIKPGPPFFLRTSPSARTKPIKGRLNYSFCMLPTPGCNSMGLRAGERGRGVAGCTGGGVYFPVWLPHLNPQDTTL